MKKNFELLNYFILNLLKFYLIVDSLTGITLKTVGVSLSIPFKLFIVALMIFAIFYCNLNYVLLIFLTISWFTLTVLYFVFVNYLQMGISIQTFMKFFSNLVFYLYFLMIQKFDKYDNSVYKIILINSVVFFSNIFLGLLGVGYSTYGYGVGIKGFFYAGNEIFLILLAISVYFMNLKIKKRYYFYCLCLICSFLIGTKTAMLALVVIIFCDFYFELSKKQQFCFLIFLPIFLLICVIIFNVFLVNIDVVKNAMYNFNKVKNASGSILNALLSGRLVFLENNINMWKENLNSINFLFGGHYYFDSKNIEIDFFDALLLNGIVTTLCVLFFYIYFIFKAIKNKNKILTILNILVLTISFSAGHIWANLSGGLFFVLVNVYCYKKRKIRKRKFKLKNIFIYLLRS